MDLPVLGHQPRLQRCCSHTVPVPARTANSTTALPYIFSRPRVQTCAHRNESSNAQQRYPNDTVKTAPPAAADHLPAGNCIQPAQQIAYYEQQSRQPHINWMSRVSNTFLAQKLGGALLAAALLALVMPGRRSTAVAATLPPTWQTASTKHNSSSSSSSGSKHNPVNQLASVGWSSDSSTAPTRSRAVDPITTSSSSSSPASSSSFAIHNSSSISADSPYSSSTNSSGIAAAPTRHMDATSSNTSASPAAAAAAAAAGAEELMAYERATVNLFAAARPSVVNITHLRAMQNFYTLDVHRMAVGQGSGFIWDKNGHVITNYHVIKGAAEVKVTLYDHSSCTARVVGFDSSKDIAVLKLALPRGRLEALQPVQLGSSDALKVGQSVFAIGNPFGLDHTLTQGIVSGLGREVSAGLSAIKGVIQTDAAINPGNSGGVLLNSQGSVIGINLGILDPSGKGSFSGVGFAIPIDTVRGLVDQILQHGRVRRPSLGITIAPEQVLDQLGTEGVLVLEVPAGTPAAAAGLRPTYRDVFGDIVLGDIIVGLDTRPIRSTAELVVALDERRSGDKVRCDVLRDGKRLSMTVTLGERGTYCE